MHTNQISNIIKKHFSFNPTEDQKLLIEKLSEFLNSIDDDKAFIIKGYAGTGKTSIVSALINSLPYLKKKAVLLAPTGRAAKVLTEYTGIRAFTIHKRIYFVQTTTDGYTLLTLQQNKYKNTIFIVDEASMIPDSTGNKESSLFSGRSLLEDLIYYVNQGYKCNLILIGDTAQLPPVGSEISPALDINYIKTAYRLNPDEFELKQVVRQAIESGILTNATQLRHKLKNEDFKPPFFNLNNFTDIVSITGNELEEVLNTAYSQYERENIVIICRSNKRANLFNQEVRKRVLYQDNEISTGDFMMIVKNNYYWLPEDSETGFIANGDIVEILKIKKTEEIYGFRFADVTLRLIDFPDEKDLDVKILLNTIDAETPSLDYNEYKRLWAEIMKDSEDLNTKRERYQKVKNSPYLNALQVKFAYSLTCHKTQGGQWDIVFIDQGYITEEMINTEFIRWLYTATTRAIKKLYLINFSDFFFENNQ